MQKLWKNSTELEIQTGSQPFYESLNGNSQPGILPMPYHFVQAQTGFKE